MSKRINHLYEFGPFQLDATERLLRRQEEVVPVTPKVVDTLLVLVKRAGHVVGKDEIMQEVWPDTFVEEGALAKNVSVLRRVLGTSPSGAEYIETIPKRGYRFVAPVQERQEESEVGAAPRVRESHLVRETGGISPLPPDGGINPPLPPDAATASPRRILPRWVRRRAWAALVVVIVLALTVAGWRWRSLRQSGPGPIRSLAVLPLENLSGDPAQEYFADGMTDALITNLAKLGALRVISRTSVVRYKGVKRPLPQIGRELNVDAVVEGTVTRAGGRVRIDAQLIQAANDRHLWAESYERELKDVLSLQDEVARDIASRIQVKLTAQESAGLSRAQPVNPEAYQRYLQGRYFWNKRSEEGFIKAIEFFDQAIAKQPDYAPAYAGLSDVYALLGTWPNAKISRSETTARARAAALKALEMDDTLAEAHASLASVSMLYDWNWPVAEKEFKRAIQLNPGYATAHHWYAFYCASQGRMEEALREIRLAQQLDPLSLIINTDVGEILYNSRRYDEAVEQSRKTLEMDPNFAAAHNCLGVTYLAKQQYPESIAELETAVRLSHGQPHFMAYLGIAYAQAGRREEARKILKQIRTGPSARYDSVLAIAWILAALGERDQAFAWVEKVYPTRPHEFYLLKVRPVLDPLRSDPRFQDLVRRVGLPP